MVIDGGRNQTGKGVTHGFGGVLTRRGRYAQKGVQMRRGDLPEGASTPTNYLIAYILRNLSCAFSHRAARRIDIFAP